MEEHKNLKHLDKATLIVISSLLTDICDESSSKPDISNRNSISYDLLSFSFDLQTVCEQGNSFDINRRLLGAPSKVRENRAIDVGVNIDLH